MCVLESVKKGGSIPALVLLRVMAIVKAKCSIVAEKAMERFAHLAVYL